MLIFVYTKHVEMRLSQRGLSKRRLEEVIAHPDRTLATFKGRVCVRKCFNGHTLEVVYKRLRNNIIVITAYWLKEV